MTRPRLLAKKAVRPILFAAGCLFVVVGIAGLVLPLLPGTVFLILAAACFARSSPRFENWLVTHPQFGPSIRAWRKNGAIPLRAKIIAVVAMALSFVLTYYSGAPPVALWATGLALVAAALYVATRPSTRQ
jgi:uncharacterized membrane protein YbaN (DUF454 family)